MVLLYKLFIILSLISSQCCHAKVKLVYAAEALSLKNLLKPTDRQNVSVSHSFLTSVSSAGSKIRFTSILHMSWELLATLLGYVVTKSWCIRLQEKKRI
jgi:hypothetical protein